MSRYHSYINTAQKIIESYKGDKPFAIFIKQFFAAEKKYGAKDRRQVAALCYNYFRMGFAARHLPADQQLLLASFLCEHASTELMEKLQPGWNAAMALPLNDKLALVANDFAPAAIFPFRDELSSGVDVETFCSSFLVQPDLFIRIRPQTRIAALKKLERSKMPHRFVTQDCVALATAEKLDDYFIIDKEIVVQDYNSQQVLNYLKQHHLPAPADKDKSKPELSIWDCCAASGGKSILLNDILNRKIDLTVSDIRASIVLNLHRRFKKAGIKEYKYFIADITSTGFKKEQVAFDLVICDAPCSGSGTWSRTPEQLCFFKQAAIVEYSNLQKKIITNVMPYLQTGGLFVYITCSVFKKENEDVAKWVTENFSCRLLEQQLLTGYDKKADSMFVAVFEKQ